MKKVNYSKWFLYRHRYVLGYGALALVFGFILVFLTKVTPGGLAEAEMQSAASSHELGFDNIFSSQIVNLPYSFLQKISIQLLGLSSFSVKLPSIILAFLSGLGLVVLLNRWFKNMVAILSSSVIVTTSLFFFAAVSGTMNIMYIFLPVVILILGSLVLNVEKPKLIYTILLFLALGVALYVPFLVYVVLAIGLVSIIHPHLRFTFKNLPRIQLILGLVIFGLMLVPLGVATFMDRATLGQLLLGQNYAIIGNINIFNNLRDAFLPFISFRAAVDSSLLVPTLGLANIALVLLGTINSIKERFTAKNYILTAWMLFAIVACVIDSTKIFLLFVPLTILLASGLELIINKWYVLFPENPYARVGGLIPLTFFIVVIITTGISHFTYGYYYSPAVAKYFNNDIALIRDKLEDGSVILASSGSTEYRFYKILEDELNVSVMETAPETVQSNLIVIRSYEKRNEIKHALSSIVTSRLSNEADRLYIYK